VKSCEYTNKWHAVEVTFANASDRPIKSVHFLVMSASGPIQAVDHDGNFAPGSQTTRRSYADMERTHAQVAVTCVPATVTFTDGTQWQSSTVGPDLEHTLAQTPGSPIHIRDCRAVDTEDEFPDWHYTYVDRAEQPATNVSIGFVEGGVLIAKKDDAGTFSPGIEIVRDFAASQIVPNDVLGQRCVVLSAAFADGTTWKNPSPLPTASWIPFAPTGPSGGQITITSCDSSKVHYRNDGPLTTSAVDIGLIEGGSLVRSLRDVHTLGPQDELTSFFFAIKTQIAIKDEACVPLRVQYADGSQWVNPALTARTNGG
ncbi:MAG TPA: hypothetical protein VFN49_07935, partial [Candidatus Aquilonibacter sp.]|nr:hypothetical protein [Candidatus Aquilonibacter sp.]